MVLTHWVWVILICIDNLTIIDSYNDMLTGQHQASIWTNVVMLLIGTLETNLNEISFEILTFSFKQMHLNM